MTDNSQLGMNLPNTQNLDKVEGYKFEPIKGYPMLHWKGKRPFTSTQFYPAQQKESHGADVDGWRNKIFWGDNLQVMSHLLKDFRGKVNLVYIDPPFDSKADYKKKIQLRGQSITNDQNTFEEKQYTDIWNNDEYLQFMYERLILIRELLADNGSIYLHCDWHKSHFLRCMLDEIFGASNFKNEIVWWYSGWNKVLTKSFEKRHDNILFYTKGGKQESEDPRDKNFNSFCIPYANKDEYLASRKQKSYIDEDGREYTLDSRDGGNRQTKVYVDVAMKRGKPVDDVWQVDKVNNSSLDKINYPTQKPDPLLERIIKASSNEGDLVFDCFMGSGTTQAVAMKLGRRFIGADINLGAVQITTKRLLGVAAELEQQQQQGKLQTDDQAPTTYYTGFEVYNVNHYDVFRNPLEAKDLLLEALEIQRLDQGNLFDGEKDGRMVKIMPVNRIATKADLSEIITGLDYKTFERRQNEAPNKPVEKITLICMGHEPDLAATLISEVKPFNIDVEVVDILRDKSNLEFKRDSEAKIKIDGDYLIIDQFYPMNLLQKLSLQQENVEEWRELVESVMIDWNYDGAILEPKLVDIPDKKELVSGRYKIPEDAGTIRVKITDLLSESLEVNIEHG
jgi:site-specific DNA-methyltransferase (adenine-specific)/adenine-specific DNA-methyltransferase